MGNALAGKRRVAKVMTVDGATSRYKTPATAAAALRGHPPGHRLLESGDVRRLGVGEDGAVRLRMRLPKAEVARLMEESRDAAEAAERIMKLCVARDQGGGGGVMVAGAPAASSGLVSAMSSGRKTSVMKKEKRTSKRNCRDLEHEKPLLHGFLSLPSNS
uniref:Uncharacterized protein n=1 Tax=Leersia perrieri TaxID=77586 RepID=A0A0D9XDJ2_9ORYZ